MQGNSILTLLLGASTWSFYCGVVLFGIMCLLPSPPRPTHSFYFAILMLYSATILTMCSYYAAVFFFLWSSKSGRGSIAKGRVYPPQPHLVAKLLWGLECLRGLGSPSWGDHVLRWAVLGGTCTVSGGCGVVLCALLARIAALPCAYAIIRYVVLCWVPFAELWIKEK